MRLAADRRGYYASGDVDCSRFLPAAAASLVAAAAVGALLDVAYRHQLYLVLMAPLGASLAVAGAVHLAVLHGRCRGRWVAAALGGFAAALMFASYFYVAFVREVGAADALRVEALPDYVVWRTENAMTQSGVEKARNLGVGFNWFLFLMELGLSVGVVAYVAQRAASRSFCEVCGRWQKRIDFKAAPGAVAAIADALERHEFALDEVVPITPGQNEPYDQIVLEYCHQTAASTASCPIYLTLDEYRASPARLHFQRTSHLRQQVIDQAELDELAPLVPPLATAIDAAARLMRSMHSVS